MDESELSKLQLELVTFERDRQQIFEALIAAPVVVSAFGSDRTHFRFEVQKIERSFLFLVLQHAASDRRPHSSEKVILTFGLDEGQFFIKGPLESVAGDLYMIPVGENLFRLQRRSNFRAPVPESMRAVFKLRKNDPGSSDQELSLIDISGGGLGLLIPKGKSIPVVPGDEVKGVLHIAGRDPLELEGVIRHIWPPDPDGNVKVGLQCRNLSTLKRRELVAICMQIHRELYSVFRGFNR